jgi:hypothetical protein
VPSCSTVRPAWPRRGLTRKSRCLVRIDPINRLANDPPNLLKEAILHRIIDLRLKEGSKINLIMSTLRLRPNQFLDRQWAPSQKPPAVS